VDRVTVIMMCLFLGGVWGGFVYALWAAIRKEKIKERRKKSEMREERGRPAG